MKAAAAGAFLVAALAVALAACSGTPQKTAPPASAERAVRPAQAVAGTPRKSPYAPAREDVRKRGDYTPGGLYAPQIRDSAPDGLPDVDLIPEPQVKAEPRSRYGNRSPYDVLGKSYRVLDSAAGYDETGLASFYGNKFHGRRTSSLEVYDMYAFTAAHKTLPLPSYARVTNLANGRSVVVRINDRGPFHDGRIIDLSYAAAVKLGVDRAGTARVEVKGLSPGEDAREDGDAVAARQDPSAPRDAATGLPPGVHIATGNPQPASGIDQLVAALPMPSAGAGERPQQPAQAMDATTADNTVAVPSTIATQRASREWRFDMRQDGRTMSADEFDAWMLSRRARVATGKPGTPATRVASAQAPSLQSAPLASEVAIVPAASVGLSPVSTPGPTPVTNDGLVFQVASFAAHDNAERALAMLNGAGIAGARLLDADANGRRVWRLRVGPVDPVAAPELVARIQGLGFGQPQRVRE